MKTISEAELRKRLDLAKQVPGLAHLPSFGLIVHDWDYQDAKLTERATKILQTEGVAGVVYEVAPALFWYRDLAGEPHLHFWC